VSPAATAAATIGVAETESACRPKVSSRCASSAMPSAARVIVPSRPAAAVSMVESTGSSSSEARFGSAIAAMAASCGDVSQPLIVSSRLRTPYRVKCPILSPRP